MDSIAFTTFKQLANRIDAYFNLSNEAPQNEKKSKGKTEPAQLSEATARDAEPATLSGLALYLGFNSLAAFEDYEQKGEFAPALQRARLRLQAIYERRLLQQSPTGAMFALKSFGWDERSENKTGKDAAPKTFTIKIIETGFQPAGDEKEVILN
ncbi:terminase small subunit [Mucilaginibacter gotjawali]|uniref:Uncharacterized protein n=1 Tax=Mucilaginibacter gotjawali TaxID=1550579 RepID=A0A839SHC5_9SPHI|nr:terminase small subunit [Mucilaginibacter gotjawali]MBB3057246.1 hypothetical protein [Mucilaginibacter gotjawali]